MSTRFNRATGIQLSPLLTKMPIADDFFICYRHQSIVHIGFLLGGLGQGRDFNLHPPILGASGFVGVGSDGLGFTEPLD